MQTVSLILSQSPKPATAAPPGMPEAAVAFADIIGLLQAGSVPTALVTAPPTDVAGPPTADDANAASLIRDDAATDGITQVLPPVLPFWPTPTRSIYPQESRVAAPAVQAAVSSLPGVTPRPDAVPSPDVAQPFHPAPVQGHEPKVVPTDAAPALAAPRVVDVHSPVPKPATNLQAEASIGPATPPSPIAAKIAPAGDQPAGAVITAPAAPVPAPVLAAQLQTVAVPQDVIPQQNPGAAAGPTPPIVTAANGDRTALPQLRQISGDVRSVIGTAGTIDRVTARSYAFLQPPATADAPVNDGAVIGPADDTAVEAPRHASVARVAAGPRDGSQSVQARDAAIADARNTPALAADQTLLPGPDRTVAGMPDTMLPPVAGPAQSAPGPTGPMQATPLAAVPQAVTAAFQDNPAQPVELRLDPPELGSVRFRMDQTHTDLVVTIIAERPDTLDLMRRHADQLLADLRQAGFQGASLNFGASHEQGGGSGTPQMPPGGTAPQPGAAAPPPSFTAPAPPPPRAFKGGLNLRL